MRFILAIGAALAAGLALSTPSRGSEPMPARFVAPLQQIFVRAQAPGMIATIIDGDRVYVLGLGRTRSDRPAPPDENTLVHLNSLSKLMAGQILAGLLAQNTVALGDRLQRFAPTGRRVPRYPGARALTIRDLVTHVSGIKRDLPLSIWKAPGSPKQARWAWFERAPLQHEPGRVAQYSNAAYLLLGDAMEKASGQSYADLLIQFVSGPQQLSDTTLRPTPSQCARLLSARTGGDAECAANDTTGASWGVYATSKDIARWMQAHIKAGQGSLLAETQRPLVNRTGLKSLIALDMAGRTEAIGYGWLHMKLGEATVLQKTGGGSATMNYLILSPEKKKGLFITVSRMDIEMLRGLTKAANSLMSGFLNAPS